MSSLVLIAITVVAAIYFIMLYNGLVNLKHNVAKAYGVAYEQFLPEANLIMGGVPKRSAFVIDKQGVIRFVDVKDHPKDLPDFEALKSTLASL